MDLTEYFQDCLNFAAKGRPVNWQEVATTIYNGAAQIIKERDEQIGAMQETINGLKARLPAEPATEAATEA